MQTPTPCRSHGSLFSYKNELYMLGGWATTMYLNPQTLTTDPKSEPWVRKGEQFLMRLDSKTHRWQAEESAGLPTTKPWDPYHYIACTGLQLMFVSPSPPPPFSPVKSCICCTITDRILFHSGSPQAGINLIAQRTVWLQELYARTSCM